MTTTEGITERALYLLAKLLNLALSASVISQFEKRGRIDSIVGDGSVPSSMLA
jgi:hypothetical protein